MRKLLLSVVVLSFCVISNAQTFSFAKQFGSTNTTTAGSSLGIDPSGNSIVLIHFSGVMDFDPGPGQYLLNGADGPVFEKLDPSGNFVSARQVRLPPLSVGQIVLDADQSVYVVGYFSGTIDADPGAGVNSMTSYGYDDIIIEKLDAAGTFVWAKQIGGEARDQGKQLVVANGNIYFAGEFGYRGNTNLNTTVDFDPDLVNEYLLTSSGGHDGFVCCFNSIDGSFQWAQKKDVGLHGADSAGNLYLFGPYNVGPTTVSKMDGSGNLLWSQAISPNPVTLGCYKVSSAGEILLTGGFNGNITMGGFSLSATTIQDAFFARISTEGTVLWAKQFRGNSFAWDMDAGADGNYYLAARISGIGNVDIDPGPGNMYNNPKGVMTMVVEKLNSNGGLVWAKLIGGNKNTFTEATKVAFSNSGAVYTLASFSGTVDFDPGTAQFNLTSRGTRDLVIHKMTQGGAVNRVMMPAVEIPAAWKLVTANRIIGIRNLQEESLITVTNMSGQVIYNGRKISGNHNLVMVPSGGVYVVTIQSAKQIQSKKLIVP